MKSIYLVIRKMAPVPHVHAGEIKMRKPFIIPGKLSYEEVAQLFHSINPQATIVTDAQFAGFIKDRFGEGQYALNYGKLGQKGWGSFIHIICGPESFSRVPRKATKAQRDIQKLRAQQNKLKYELARVKTTEKQFQLQEKIAKIEIECQESAEVRSEKYGCAGYLRSRQPVYKEHPYENYKILPDMKKLDEDGPVVVQKNILPSKDEAEKVQQEVFKPLTW